MRKSSRNSKSSKPATPRTGIVGKPASAISELLMGGLSTSFASLRDRIGDSITDKGEEYLERAIEKLNKTTKKLAKWSTKHPVKLACGIAAVMAVSGFLAHTMKAGPSSMKKQARKAS
jgi:hypothetical protein